MNSIEVIRKVAEEEVRKLHLVELGIVTSIFPHQAATDMYYNECHVKLKNRDLELRRVPVATQNMGLAMIPEVGDLVMVTYINGDINAPVIIGRLYNDDNPPPVNARHEMVYESPYATERGVRRIYLKFPNKFVLTVTDDNLQIEMGTSKIVVETDGSITISTSKDIKLDAPNGKISLSAMNIDLNATNTAAVKGQQSAQLTSSANAEVSGSMTKIEGQASLTVKSSGIATLQGTLVKIN